MENNFIHLREGYYAVVLPLDAKNIDRERRNDGQYFVSWSEDIMVFEKPWLEFKSVAVGNKQKISIIGLLNEITEDQAREILDWPLDGPESFKRILNILIKEKTAIWEQSERETKRILLIKTEI